MTMLNDQENSRLAEIERFLLITDPRFVRRMGRTDPRGRLARWFRRTRAA